VVAAGEEELPTVPVTDLLDPDRIAGDVPILIAVCGDAGVVLVAELGDVGVVLVAADVEARRRCRPGGVAGAGLGDGAVVEVALMTDVGDVVRATGLTDHAVVGVAGLLDLADVVGTGLRDRAVVAVAGLGDGGVI